MVSIVKINGTIAIVAILAYMAFTYVTSPRYYIGQAHQEFEAGALEPLTSYVAGTEQLENGVVRTDHFLAVPALVVGSEEDSTIPATLDLFVSIFEQPASLNGATVMFIHGGPATPLEPPRMTINALLASGKVRRVAFHHARGCGRSQRPFDKMDDSMFVLGHLLTIERALGIGAQVADVERVRRFVTGGRTERVAVVGFSFGGFIAPLYAAEFPYHISALYLVAPAPLMQYPPADGKDLFHLMREPLSALQTSTNMQREEALAPILSRLDTPAAKERLYSLYSSITSFNQFLDGEFLNTIKTLKRSDRLMQCMSLDLQLFYSVTSEYPTTYYNVDTTMESAGCPRLGSSMEEGGLKPLDDPIWYSGGGWVQLATFSSIGMFSSFGASLTTAFEEKLQHRPSPFCSVVLHTNKDLVSKAGSEGVFAVLPQHPQNAMVSVNATHFVFYEEESLKVIETGEAVFEHLSRSITECL